MLPPQADLYLPCKFTTSTTMLLKQPDIAGCLLLPGRLSQHPCHCHRDAAERGGGVRYQDAELVRMPRPCRCVTLTCSLLIDGIGAQAIG